MKTTILATLSWLASSAAAGPLGTDAISTHAIPMRKHDLGPSTTHPAALQRRVKFPARLKNIRDVYYSIDLTVGNQTVSVGVDTGSSDTWMVQEPYECVSFWFEPAGVSFNLPPQFRCLRPQLLTGAQR